MARLRGQARLPYAVVDVLAQMHASVDPDSGHMVCHYHEVGAAVVEVGGRDVPMLLVGGCLLATADPAAVEAIEAESERLESLPASLHSAPSTAQWLAQVLQLVHELSAEAEARRMKLDGLDTVAFIVRNRGLAAAVILAPHCSREVGKRGGAERSPGIYV